MTNDLTTLSGALLEMKDELIYQLGQKGVTASYDSTTGLLGLIGEISNIQQGGGSCYKVTFDNASYTTTDSVTVSVTVLKNYNACVGETVTFTSSTSTTTTATTDSNGVATATISFSGSTTLTASIGGATDTATVTVSQYLFYDDASVDNSSNYTSYGIQGTSGKVNITFENNAYKITNNTSSGRALLQFGNTVMQNNIKISADIKLGGSTYKQNGMLAFIDKDSQSTYSVAGWVQGQKYYRLTEFNGTSELQTTPNSTWSSLSTSDYNHHELVYQNGVVTYTVTTPSSQTKTVSLTLQKSNYLQGKLGLFIEVFSSATHCYIKNITAESL